MNDSYGKLLLYGATGFTGKLVLRRALSQGLRPIVAARNRQRLLELAAPAGLEARVADLEDPSGLDTLLADIDVVVNLAGPFSKTARPLVKACLSTRTHYLDVTGEVSVLDDLRRYDADARSRGIMILPGAAFAVVPSDCLAARVAARLPGGSHLRIGFTRSRFMSRGSARTAVQLLGSTIPVCRDGRITSVPAGDLHHVFDFGRGPTLCTATGWGDVATAHRSTGIPNVETYIETWPWERASLLWMRVFGSSLRPFSGLFESQLRWLPEGPSATARASDRKQVVVEVEDPNGRLARSRMSTPDGYEVTADAAVLIAGRVLEGDYKTGVQTPATVFGPQLLESLSGVFVEDLDP